MNREVTVCARVFRTTVSASQFPLKTQKMSNSNFSLACAGLLFLIIYVLQFLLLTAEEPQSGAVMIKYICALYVGQVNCHTVTQSLNPYQKYLYTLQFNLKTSSSPPFLAWVDFQARSCFARSTIPEEKWGTTRSLFNLFIFCIATELNAYNHQF